MIYNNEKPMIFQVTTRRLRQKALREHYQRSWQSAAWTLTEIMTSVSKTLMSVYGCKLNNACGQFKVSSMVEHAPLKQMGSTRFPIGSHWKKYLRFVSLVLDINGWMQGQASRAVLPWTCCQTSVASKVAMWPPSDYSGNGCTQITRGIPRKSIKRLKWIFFKLTEL